jgi:hypothetical protein
MHRLATYGYDPFSQCQALLAAVKLDAATVFELLATIVWMDDHTAQANKPIDRYIMVGQTATLSTISCNSHFSIYFSFSNAS